MTSQSQSVKFIGDSVTKVDNSGYFGTSNNVDRCNFENPSTEDNDYQELAVTEDIETSRPELPSEESTATVDEAADVVDNIDHENAYAGATIENTDDESLGKIAGITAGPANKSRRKYNKLDMTMRQNVIRMANEGSSCNSIARIIGANASTVAGIIRRYKRESRIALIPQRGRPTKLSDDDKFMLVKYLRRTSGNVSIIQLTRYLRETRNTIVHAETIRRFVNEYWKNDERLRAQFSRVNRDNVDKD